jgi:sec-independent protein translocase protein TatC
MMSLAVPIVVLYEISIWSAKMVEKKKAERDAALDAELKD